MAKETSRRPRVLVLEGLSGASWCVELAGGNAVAVSPYNLKGVEYALKHTPDALLLTGGGDVDPRLYGAKPRKEVYGVSEQRDFTECWALDEARVAGIPVFGICRGAQIMAVEAGGTLCQHIRGHSGVTHGVVANGRTKAAAGRRHFAVTSLHHQEVARVPKGWKVSSRAPDGTTESVESLDGRCIGVQFHPELDPYEDYSRGMFRWLVTSAAEHSGLALPSARVLMPTGTKKTAAWGWDDDEPFELMPAPRAGTFRAMICEVCRVQFDSEDDFDDHSLFVHHKTPDHWEPSERSSLSYLAGK